MYHNLQAYIKVTNTHTHTHTHTHTTHMTHIYCTWIHMTHMYTPTLSLSLSRQATNSTRYQHLIDKLFSEDAPQLRPSTFYLEPGDNKRDRLKRVNVHDKITTYLHGHTHTCSLTHWITQSLIHSLNLSLPLPHSLIQSLTQSFPLSHIH